jgi:hypothetical protein
MEIYHRARSNAKYEQLILDYLQHQCAGATFHDKTWHPPAAYLLVAISKNILLNRVSACNELSPNKKQKIRKILKKRSIPDSIRIATEPDAISFDFAIVDKNQVKLLVEVHEKQHRTLSISKPTTIYDKDGWPIKVPRYIQRLIRDIWRFNVARTHSINYLVVWFDWLLANNNPIIYPVKMPGQYEFAKSNKFRISDLA